MKAILGVLACFLLCAGYSEASVVWSDDFSDGDISDWVRGENGQVWTAINGELVQPGTQYLGNSVLTYELIPWGDYALDWDMRPTAKSDALGPVCWAQSGPAAAGFDWDCSLDVNGVPTGITMCGELGRTYHFRIETIGGVASVYIDGAYIGSGPYDPSYSLGFSS